MTENAQAKQPGEPGQQGPTSKGQAEATEELSDEQLDQVAGGLKVTGVEGESTG